METINQRKELRKHNIDIEVNCVFTEVNGRPKKGGYRYIISPWGPDNILTSNTYGNDIYDTYEDAEKAAVTEASKIAQYKYVD